ncbi:hypothetical protein A33M_2542 [Rhodovulum sp. PH10]|nr:hypothetical protein A33M_2542 [Rhodovulum sp. PH10]
MLPPEIDASIEPMFTHSDRSCARPCPDRRPDRPPDPGECPGRGGQPGVAHLLCYR